MIETEVAPVEPVGLWPAIPESLAGSHGESRSAGKPDRAELSTWRASEMYENKVKNADKARAAYGRVPPTSSHYKDAQKKLTKVKNYKAKGKRQKAKA